MQKTFKRTISLLLSILMIVGIFTIVPITASAVTTDDINVLYRQMSMLAEERDQQGDYDAADGLMYFSSFLYDELSESGYNADDPNVERAYNIALAVYNHFNGTGSVDVTSVSAAEVNKLEDALFDLTKEYHMSDDYNNAHVLSFVDDILLKAYRAADGNSEDQNLLSAYSLASTILAQYTGTTASYTVTWKNGDTTLETDTDVAEGATPTYDGEAPTKAEDEQNTYTFSGWSDGNTTYGLSDTLPAVSGDVTYTAQFTANAKPAPTFTVTWKNWDGSDLEVDTEVEKDTLPTYDGETPAKAEDGENVYTFAAWDDGTTTYVLGVDDLPAVTADVTYTAVFTAGKKEIIDGKYYVGGELTKGTGLVKVGNDIYYVKITGDIYKNSTLSVAESKTNGLKPQGNYYFNEEGKLTVNNGIVNGFYYVDGILQKGAGLVQIDNDIYFVKQSGAIYKNSSIMVPEAKTNGLKAPGLYFFDEDGKLEEKNGVYGGFYYENSEIVKGKGIVEFENNLYFVKLNGTIYTGNRLMVPASKTNDLIPAGVYDFASDGKILRDPS